jgi:hypothetical protein
MVENQKDQRGIGMAYLQADLDAIEAAIKSGALKVKYQDKEVTYRSMDELMRIRDLMRKDLGLSNSTPRIFTKFGKGL